MNASCRRDAARSAFFLPSFSQALPSLLCRRRSICSTSLRSVRSPSRFLPADRRLNGDFKHLACNVFLEFFDNRRCARVRLFGMHDKRQRVDHLAVQQNIELDEVGLAVADELVIKRGITLCARFQRIKEVKDNLIERQLAGVTRPCPDRGRPCLCVPRLFCRPPMLPINSGGVIMIALTKARRLYLSGRIGTRAGFL